MDDQNDTENESLILRHELIELRAKLDAEISKNAHLVSLLKHHGIVISSDSSFGENSAGFANNSFEARSILTEATLENIQRLADNLKPFVDDRKIIIRFKDLSFWNMSPKTKINTVGTTFCSLFCGSGPKTRLDILKKLSGEIQKHVTYIGSD